MNEILIDRFVVPPEAAEEFLHRVKMNRDFIKKLPGFIETPRMNKLAERAISITSQSPCGRMPRQ